MFIYSIQNCLNVSYWRSGEPSNSYNNEHCVEMWPDWNDQTCTDTLAFLCNVPKQYILITQEMSWQNAENYCINTYQTHLASISNQYELEQINYFTTKTSKSIWIGLNGLNDLNQDTAWFVYILIYMFLI